MITATFSAGREAATETGGAKLREGSSKEIVGTGSRYVIRRDEGDKTNVDTCTKGEFSAWVTCSSLVFCFPIVVYL